MPLTYNTINLHSFNPSNLVFKIKSNTKRKIDFDNNSISKSNSPFFNRLITSLKISFENPYATYELSKVASSINLTTIELNRPHITTFFTHTHHLSSIPSNYNLNDSTYSLYTFQTILSFTKSKFLLKFIGSRGLNHLLS